MYEYTILLLILVLFKTIAFDGTTEYPLNVGTVVFSTEDLKNNRWSKSKIGLLRARRYFQSFMPPANLINTVNENYIDALMRYFEDGYSTIKTEAVDAETDRIMTIALSDVIGGYLKSWALPITKFAFYGGTITQNHAIRLFKFYDELRNYMGTDGDGWTSPDSSIISSIDINVAEPKHVSNTRSMSDPCDHLAYFIKTPTGLSIPIPHVNWDKQSNTMFIPLKNYSLIPLGLPNSSNALFKYYDAAKNCMQTNGQQDRENFDEKFQNWLLKEVVPHLSDDRLYLAFESILSLVNTSQTLYDTAKDMKELLSTNNSNYRNKFSIGGMPVDMTSKKILIITIILFLEVGWCIPALLYILCSKKKKGKNDSNVYMIMGSDLDRDKYHKENLKLEKQDNKKRSGKREIYENRSKVELNMVKQNDGCGGLKTFKMPRHINVETNIKTLSKNSMATSAQSFYSSKIYSTEIARVTYDAPVTAIKPSLKKITTNNTNVVTKEHNPSQKDHGLCLCTPNQSIEQSSFSTIQELDSSKTVTLLANKKHNTSKHKPTNNIRTPREQENSSSNNVNENVKRREEVCPCTNCFKEKKVLKQVKDNSQSQKSSRIITKSKPIVTYTNENEKQMRLSKRNTQKTYLNKGKSLKINSRQPYLEITIGKPKQDISVDIRSIARDVSPKNTRPSKIPKRAATVAITDTQNKQNTSAKGPVDANFKNISLIPQPNKQTCTVDDIGIKNRDTSTVEKKLNITL